MKSVSTSDLTLLSQLIGNFFRDRCKEHPSEGLQIAWVAPSKIEMPSDSSLTPLGLSFRFFPPRGTADRLTAFWSVYGCLGQGGGFLSVDLGCPLLMAKLPDLSQHDKTERLIHSK